MPNKYDFGYEANLTDEQLAGELAKLSPPTEAQIKELLPTLEDQQYLDRIMAVVNSASSDNQKASDLVETIGKLSQAAKTALVKFLGSLA
jgi:hypothetical protein